MCKDFLATPCENFSESRYPYMGGRENGGRGAVGWKDTKRREEKEEEELEEEEEEKEEEEE